MAARRQLPLPDGVAPQRRAPPALPREDSESPPPPVPSRPIPGKPAPAVPNSSRPLPTTPSMPKQPPQKPVSVPEPEENEYDEGDAGEIYDEAANGGSDHEEQETYDDMDVGEAVGEPQEEYADCEVQEEEEVEQQSYDDFEAVAQDTYEVEETQEEYQECEVGEPVREDLYQVADNESPSPPPPIAPAPALPPPRPKQKKDDTAAPPPPRESAKKPIKGAGPMPGMPAIGMGDIQNIKDRLKKVTMHTDEKIEKKEPKVYTDSNELKQTFNFFKQKEKEALAKGNKPEITPKPPGLNLKKSTPVKDNKTNSPVLPTRPSDKSTSLHRNTSDSLPSPRDADLPPPPPPVSDIPPVHSRDLPPPPPSGNDTPQLPPPRGKDGYTKVAVSHPEENNNEDGEEPEDFYDDALSFNDPLLKESWYFGDIERTVGNDKLKKLNMNGGYLLRKSTKGGDKQPFTLMVIYSNHVYNLKIRERRDGRVALGEEKPDEMSFLSVADLIKHHQTNDVILVHRDGKQDTTMLIKSPAK